MVESKLIRDMRQRDYAFLDLCYLGDLRDVRKMYQIEMQNGNPIHLNIRDDREFGRSPLQTTITGNNREVFEALMQFAGDVHVDVNARDARGFTALTLAISIPNSNQEYFLDALLRDPGVDARITALSGGLNALHMAMVESLKTVEKLIASRKPLDADRKHDNAIYKGFYTAEGAENIVENYLGNPNKISNQCAGGMKEWQYRQSQLFGLVVFLSDGLLKSVRKGVLQPLQGGDTRTRTAAEQFFYIASRLPIEMQSEMTRSYAGSAIVTLTRHYREEAFKTWAVRYKNEIRHFDPLS